MPLQSAACGVGWGGGEEGEGVTGEGGGLGRWGGLPIAAVTDLRDG